MAEGCWAIPFLPVWTSFNYIRCAIGQNTEHNVFSIVFSLSSTFWVSRKCLSLRNYLLVDAIDFCVRLALHFVVRILERKTRRRAVVLAGGGKTVRSTTVGHWRIPTFFVFLATLKQSGRREGRRSAFAESEPPPASPANLSKPRGSFTQGVNEPRFVANDTMLERLVNRSVIEENL